MQNYKKKSTWQKKSLRIQNLIVSLHPETDHRKVKKAASQTNDALHALLERARNYCSLSEQCEDAVRQKLVTWGATPEQSNAVVESLFRDNYLDNLRYARAYCTSKILSQHWGRQKVLYNLRLKHLPRAAVDSGIAAVSEEDYFRVLTEVAEKKYEELKQSHAKPETDGSDDEGGEVQNSAIRQKLSTFLATRGFTFAEINRVLDEIM